MSLCFTRPLSLPGGGVFNQIYRSSWINPPERPYHFRPPQTLSHSIVDDETHAHTHTETKDIYGWLEAAKMRCQALAGMLQCAMFIYLLFFWTLVVGQCHARRTAYRAPTHSLPLIGLIRNDRRRSCDARPVCASATFLEIFHPWGSDCQKRTIFPLYSQKEIKSSRAPRLRTIYIGQMSRQSNWCS